LKIRYIFAWWNILVSIIVLCLKILLNVNGKATRWHTHCFYFVCLHAFLGFPLQDLQCNNGSYIVWMFNFFPLIFLFLCNFFNTTIVIAFFKNCIPFYGHFFGLMLFVVTCTTNMHVFVFLLFFNFLSFSFTSKKWLVKFQFLLMQQ